jgi:hypothetical protein
MLDSLEKTYTKKFYSDWSLFIVKDSEFLKWFNDESYNIYAAYQINHFVIISGSDIIDILSTYEPEIITI